MQTNKLLMYGVFALVALVVLGIVQIPSTLAPGAIVGVGAPAGAVACTLSTTQTLANASYENDKPGTGVGPASTVFLDPEKGLLNPGDKTTTPGQTYTVYFSKANYFSDVVKVTTGCTASPSVVGKQDQVDTALTLTAYDTNGITALSTNGLTGTNMSVGSGGSATAHIKVAQSAAYKHISGNSGQFAVFVNTTNVTDWAPSQMSITWDNTPCTAYGQAGLDNTATPTAFGGVVTYAAVCSGDFQPNDGSIHELAVKYAAASGINPGTQATHVAILPIDAYQDSITGALKMKGAVKDSGAAIITAQSLLVMVG